MIRRFVKFVVATETTMVAWKARNGMDIMRVALGIVFIWFGFLKFFHGVSAAEILAGKTIFKLTFGHVKPAFSLPFLACWECTIGLGLITKRWLSFTLVLLYFQMAGTLLPLFFFQDETWVRAFVPTLLGQYIIKNMVLISSGIVIGATVQGGALIANPKAVLKGKYVEKLIIRYKRRFHEEPVIK